MGWILPTLFVESKVRSNRFSLSLFFWVFVILFMLPKSSNASSNDDNWDHEKIVVTEIINKEKDDQENCGKVWDILWTNSKNENLEARAWLSYLLFPISPHSDALIMPGRSSDHLSKIRDSLIMAAHSLGAIYDDEEYQADLSRQQNYAILHLLLSEGPLSQVGGRDFLRCYTLSQDSQCLRDAINQKLFPEFEIFVSEIDALLAQGFKPQCFFKHRN